MTTASHAKEVEALLYDWNPRGADPAGLARKIDELYSGKKADNGHNAPGMTNPKK